MKSLAELADSKGFFIKPFKYILPDRWTITLKSYDEKITKIIGSYKTYAEAEQKCREYLVKQEKDGIIQQLKDEKKKQAEQLKKKEEALQQHQEVLKQRDEVIKQTQDVIKKNQEEIDDLRDIEREFLESSASKLEFSVVLYDRSGEGVDITDGVRRMEVPVLKDPFGGIRKVKVDDVFDKIVEQIIEHLIKQSLKGVGDD